MPRGHGIPEDLKEEIVTMFKADIRVPDIADETGVSVPTVYKILKERGLTGQGVLPRHLAAMPSERLNDVIVAYTTTEEPVVSIQNRFGLTASELYAILHEADIPVRGVAQKAAVEKSIDKAIEMYTDEENPAPLWKIERETGITPQRLNRVLHRLGIPLRRSKVASVPKATSPGGNNV